MFCPKVHSWFGFQYDCPLVDMFSVALCTSQWATLIDGSSIQVCASCKIWLIKNRLAELGGRCEEKEDKSGK